ncbi:MAG: hypothetical protein JKY08_02605 [Flavobacteriaceae bacterium]|nr:hypothetical protein [Flavobacteriaceae bacterium]
MIRSIKEYKIIKPTSRWSIKDEEFIELFNENSKEGWEVLSVGYNVGGNILKAVLVRDKNV